MPTCRYINLPTIEERSRHKNSPIHTPHDLHKVWLMINFALWFMIGIPSKSEMKVFFVSPLNFWLVFKSGKALSCGHYQNRAYTWLLPCAPLFW
jgi:hypothetical protein